MARTRGIRLRGEALHKQAARTHPSEQIHRAAGDRIGRPADIDPRRGRRNSYRCADVDPSASGAPPSRARPSSVVASKLRNPADAARSRRAHIGGPTRRSEIFRERTVGFSSSTHRSHQKPLHVLIGSPLTIYEGGAVARTGSGGATMRTRNALLAYPHGRRRQQFSPASV